MPLLIFLIPLGFIVVVFVIIVVNVLSGFGRMGRRGPWRPGSGPGVAPGPMDSGDIDSSSRSWLPWMAAGTMRPGDEPAAPPVFPDSGGASPADTASPPSQDSFSGGMCGDFGGGGADSGGGGCDCGGGGGGGGDGGGGGGGGGD